MESRVGQLYRIDPHYSSTPTLVCVVQDDGSEIVIVQPAEVEHDGYHNVVTLKGPLMGYHITRLVKTAKTKAMEASIDKTQFEEKNVPDIDEIEEPEPDF